MATLCLGNMHCSAPLLRDWLCGDWGIVFSHPVDFQDSSIEYDRWLAIVRDEFRSRAVRPMACSLLADDVDASWASALMRDQRPIRLHPACTASEDIIDLTSRALHEQIARLDSHFAVIIDPSLKLRGVLKYNAGRASVSPLDLLASIDALRRRSTRGRITGRRREVRAVA